MDNKLRIMDYELRAKVLAVLVIMCSLVAAPLFAQVHSVGNFADTMAIGMGARPLGMGRAFTGFAESADSVFTNPAGLTHVKATSLTSMFSNVLSDASYSVLAAAWPDEKRGVLGAGAILTSISGIPLTSATSFEGNTTDYRNSLLFLSYGIRLDKLNEMFPGIVPVDLIPGKDPSKVEIGATVKYFSVDSGIEGLTGTGLDLDVGILYTQSPVLTLGVTGRNVLPADWGGKITYSTGVEDSIPSEVKVGAKVNLFGLEGQAMNAGDIPVNLGIDADLSNSGRTTWHYGAEAWISQGLALRVGMDQEFGPLTSTTSGITSNLAAGVGYRSGDYEFNYAYHPFNGIQQNTTHFFSIGYLGAVVPKIVPKNIIPSISLLPEDKSIVRDRTIKVEGKVSGVPDGAEIELGDQKVKVKEGKIEGTSMRLRPGKNAIAATIPAGPSNQKVSVKNRLVRLLSFADVPDGHWAKDQVEKAATAGLIEGYPDGTFQPERPLSRAELSAILIRNEGIALPFVAPTERVFKDLPGSHWAARYIQAASSRALVRGYLDNSFKANNKITKAEAVTVFVRYNRLAGSPAFGGPLAEGPFPDVPLRHWASRSISDARDSGMLEYVGEGFFQPNKALTRAEAVEILSKTAQGKKRITTLLDWEQGF